MSDEKTASIKKDAAPKKEAPAAPKKPALADLIKAEIAKIRNVGDKEFLADVVDDLVAYKTNKDAKGLEDIYAPIAPFCRRPSFNTVVAAIKDL